MSGWIILFALLALTGTGLAALQLAAPATTAFEAVGAVFTILLIVSLLLRVLRSRA